MKRQTVMIIEPKGDHYTASFPDYHAMGSITANDAATLLRTGPIALKEEIARRAGFGTGIKTPRTLGAHVFSNIDLIGKMITMVEVEFPG